MTKNKNIDFEASLDALEALVEEMEDGQMSLEDSMKAFEQGIKLTRECQTALKAAEQKVQVLLEQNGELSVEDLEQDGLDDEDDSESED